MKNINVTIKLELEVPDDWTLTKTPDGLNVINMGNGQYLDLTFEPMVTKDIEGTWSNDVGDDFMNDLIDSVLAEDISYEIIDPPMH